MNFPKWLDTFIDEKGIDTDRTFEVDGPSGVNFIPVACVIEAIKQTVGVEQNQIKSTIVKIDFMNGDVYHFFNHLAGAMAQ